MEIYILVIVLLIVAMYKMDKIKSRFADYMYGNDGKMYGNGGMIYGNGMTAFDKDMIAINKELSPAKMDGYDCEVKPIGYLAAKYMDNYKWMPIKYSQNLYTLFDVVNLVHPGDILSVKRNGKFEPAAHVISVMEIDKSFPVIVLDRSVELGGMEFGVTPTEKSVDLWKTTLYPDILKTPVTEIQSVSRWVAAVPKSQLTY